MEQYIPKSALVAEIKKIKMDIGNIFNEYDEGFWEGRTTAFDDVICALDTLEVKEVDLEKEVESLIKSFIWRFADKEDFLHIAKHFFELGLSVSNSTKVTTPDIDDTLKENGVNPYSKEARVFKESYYMALEKLKA